MLVHAALKPLDEWLNVPDPSLVLAPLIKAAVALNWRDDLLLLARRWFAIPTTVKVDPSITRIILGQDIQELFPLIQDALLTDRGQRLSFCLAMLEGGAKSMLTLVGDFLAPRGVAISVSEFEGLLTAVPSADPACLALLGKDTLKGETELVQDNLCTILWHGNEPLGMWLSEQIPLKELIELRFEHAASRLGLVSSLPSYLPSLASSMNVLEVAFAGGYSKMSESLISRCENEGVDWRSNVDREIFAFSPSALAAFEQRSLASSAPPLAHLGRTAP